MSIVLELSDDRLLGIDQHFEEERNIERSRGREVIECGEITLTVIVLLGDHS
jgi:hypothetical protein